MSQLNAEIRRDIEKNIFYAAHSAIKNWDAFKWHQNRSRGIDAHQENSSQALSIDFFGTIKSLASQRARDAILNAIAFEIGLDQDQDWDMDLEWEDPENRLSETRKRTQIDAKARGRENLILFECKFTEPGGGGCSQIETRKTKDGRNLAQCSGAYKMQINPHNQEASMCALTAKKIRYWEFIPQIFQHGGNQEQETCPFRDGNFQWMRNVVMAHAVAKDCGLRFRAVLLYADSIKLPLPQKIVFGEWDNFLRTLKNPSVYRALSYQEALTIGEGALSGFTAEQKLWKELKVHILSKIAKVAAGSCLPHQNRNARQRNPHEMGRI